MLNIYIYRYEIKHLQALFGNVVKKDLKYREKKCLGHTANGLRIRMACI